MVKVDVLVIGGGGAQGLWLLNDLSKRHYRAMPLERGQPKAAPKRRIEPIPTPLGGD